MIQPERIQPLNSRPQRPGRYVLYWMQASQRDRCNHALEYAIRQANRLGLPVVAYFGLDAHFPAANLRHFEFMLRGLGQTRNRLAERGIRLVLRREAPAEGVVALAGAAALVVADRGYLRHQRRWRQEAAARIECPFIQVETDAVVPVETASPKEEFSAATLRRKIHRLLPEFLVGLTEEAPAFNSLSLDLAGSCLDDPARLLAELDIDRTVPPVPGIPPGPLAARACLERFIHEKLDRYDRERNDPNLDALSGLSPYLHFGQISPLDVALAVAATGSPGAAPFLEELLVRRELSFNFVHYNPAYDQFAGLPRWARESLDRHRADDRPFRYAPEALEAAATHDPYWNAAQRQMVRTGKMHGYMRMYWGKKLLEWNPDPETAFATAIRLNDRYELDGRDPIGYAGVAWCVGTPARPWMERPVFGQIRYMNDNGLRRKFDAGRYATVWAGPAAEKE